MSMRANAMQLCVVRIPTGFDAAAAAVLHTLVKTWQFCVCRRLLDVSLYFSLTRAHKHTTTDTLTYPT
jgi:hypothetical protein